DLPEESSFCALSPDGQTLAVVRKLASIHLFKIAHKQSRQLAGQVQGSRTQEDDGKQVGFSPDGKWLGLLSIDGSAQVLELATDQQTAVPKAEQTAVRRLAFSEDGTVLALLHDSGCVAIWDLARQEYRTRFPSAHGLGVSSIAFSPDGEILASGSHDATVKF